MCFACQDAGDLCAWLMVSCLTHVASDEAKTTILKDNSVESISIKPPMGKIKMQISILVFVKVVTTKSSLQYCTSHPNGSNHQSNLNITEIHRMQFLKIILTFLILWGHF